MSSVGCPVSRSSISGRLSSRSSIRLDGGQMPHKEWRSWPASSRCQGNRQLGQAVLAEGESVPVGQEHRGRPERVAPVALLVEACEWHPGLVIATAHEPARRVEDKLRVGTVCRDIDVALAVEGHRSGTIAIDLDGNDLAPKPTVPGVEDKDLTALFAGREDRAVGADGDAMQQSGELRIAARCGRAPEHLASVGELADPVCAPIEGVHAPVIADGDFVDRSELAITGAEAAELEDEGSIRPKHLDAMVRAIGNVDVPVR